MFWTASVFSLALMALASSAVAGSEPAAEPAASNPQAEAAQREQRIKDRTARARREALFNRLDRDGDGYLTAPELRAEEAEQDVVLEADELDRDDDHRVSRTEFAALEMPPERSPGSASESEEEP